MSASAFKSANSIKEVTVLAAVNFKAVAHFPKEPADTCVSKSITNNYRLDFSFVGGLLTSWLTAHLVQAAAGTDTAADGDGQNNDKSSNTKDHGQCRVMSREFVTKKKETKKN